MQIQTLVNCRAYSYHFFEINSVNISDNQRKYQARMCPHMEFNCWGPSPLEIS